jgi:hypothetical protein
MLKPCAKASVAPFLDIGCDVFAINFCDVLVGHQHHDEVGPFDGFRDFLDVQTGFFGLVP